jgi:pimeloyl-ACP methyl ester carboxylesterase
MLCVAGRTQADGSGFEMLFKDVEFEAWGMRGLAWATAGGADFGECQLTASRVVDGDRDAWYREWMATGERVYAIAEQSAARGHSASASGAFLRASNYFRTATPWLFERHPSRVLKAAVRRSYEAFEHAIALLDTPAERVEIPFAGTSLPGWLVRGSSDERPLVVSTNGYDSLACESYCAHAVPALQHGYHCLIVDGPGQGLALFEGGLYLRPDWEVVTGAVLDYASALDCVDSSKIALWGWSLGGYLAPRGASGETRLAALIADPGQFSVLGGLSGLFARLGLSEDEIAHVGELSDARLQPIIDIVLKDPHTEWSLARRGMMAHGLDRPIDVLRATSEYSMQNRAGLVTCPALIGSADGDPLSATTPALLEALTCPKTSVHYTSEDGAAGHCEMTARTLVNQRTFDWLDEALA